MHIDRMKALVFRARPRLKRIYQKYGNFSVLGYARAVYPLTQATDSIVTDAAARVTERILGPDEAEKVRKSLEQSNYVSTVDHHGPLSHPSFFQPNLLRMFLGEDQGLPVTVVFSCASISLNNHTYPRGFFWFDHQGKEVRLPLFGAEQRKLSVYGAPAFSREQARRMLRKIEGYPEVSQKLSKIFDNSRLYEFQKYREQVTYINQKLMSEVTGGQSFVSLAIEDIVREMLLSHHLAHETPLSRIILDEEIRNIFLKNTDGVSSAYDSLNGKGTMLFWGNREGERVQLVIQDGVLVDTQNTTHIPLKKEFLAQALKEEKIFPNLAFCLVLLASHGLVLGGGFSQVDYLPKLLKRSRRALRQIGMESLLSKTDFLGGDFLFLPKREAEITGVNFLAHPITKEEVYRAAENVSLKKAIERIISQAYDVLIRSSALKSMKKTCLFCGNNPTSHFLSWISTGASIAIVDPVARYFSKRWIGKLLFRLARLMLRGFFEIFQIFGLVSLDPDPSRVPSSRGRVLFDEARRRHWPIWNLMALGKATDVYRVKLPGTKPFFFGELPRPDVDESPALVWMDDKAILKRKLGEAGIPVPKGKSFFSLRSAVRYFDQAARPIIVKPRLGSRGRHTTTHITERKHLTEAFRVAKKLCPFVVVEEHLEGSVYRGTVIDGVLAGVLAGDPPRVTGDGKRTIRELIEKKNREREKRVGEVALTPTLEIFLKNRGRTLDDVLPGGVTIDLSEKIGIAYGGKSREVTPEVHPKLRTALERAAWVVNDPVLGFDFITPDVTVDPDTVRWGIIECNAMPFINLHHDPLEGEPVNVAGKLWDYVLRKKNSPW